MINIAILFCAVLVSFGVQAEPSKASYPGVVQLFIKQDSGQINPLGSAVFIRPHVLMTAAHNLYGLVDKDQELKSVLGYSYLGKEEWIPIEKLYSLSIKHDVALLETKHPSKVFYNVDQSSQTLLTEKDRVTLVGFPKGEFKIIEGRYWNQYDSLMEGELFYKKHLSGSSGGAVFQTSTGKLIGMAISGISPGFYFRFMSIDGIKNLLSMPLNCSFAECMKQQTDNLLLNAIEKNSASAQHKLAKVLLATTCDSKKNNGCMVQEIKTLFTESIKQNWVPSLIDYCSWMVDPDFDYVDKNPVMGLDLCEVAVQEGNNMATVLLGEIYYHGTDNVEVNYEMAGYWFSEAVDRGIVYAKLFLGIMKFVGRGMNQNESEALCLFESANQDFKNPKIEHYIKQLHQLGFSCQNP